MKIRTCLALALLLITLIYFPAAAQDSQCLEIWGFHSDSIYHEVNIDSGEVVSYTPTTPTYESRPNTSPDGRYTANLERDNDTGQSNLTLTDNTVGVSVTLARNVSSVAWSLDSVWLAYVQLDAERPDTATLVLSNIEGSEPIISLPLLETGLLDWLMLRWSPDGSALVVGLLTVIEPETWELHVYSVPDLALMTSYESLLGVPQLHWSPTGNSLLIYDRSNNAVLTDMASMQHSPFALDGFVNYQFLWSPDESYLLVSHTSNDWLDAFDVLTLQGETLLDDIIVSTNYDATVSDVDWVNDHQLIAQTWTPEGFYDLTFFDVQTGEQQILQPFISFYELSHDRRYAAVIATETRDVIQLYDFSLDEPTIVAELRLDSAPYNFIWREDRLELLVLTEDRVLRAYDVESDTWRDIATIPNEESIMRFVTCSHS